MGGHSLAGSQQSPSPWPSPFTSKLNFQPHVRLGGAKGVYLTRHAEVVSHLLVAKEVLVETRACKRGLYWKLNSTTAIQHPEYEARFIPQLTPQ